MFVKKKNKSIWSMLLDAVYNTYRTIRELLRKKNQIRERIESFLERHPNAVRVIAGHDFDDPHRIYIVALPSEDEEDIAYLSGDVDMDVAHETFELIKPIFEKYGYKDVDYADEGLSTVFEKKI